MFFFLVPSFKLNQLQDSHLMPRDNSDKHVPRRSLPYLRGTPLSSGNYLTVSAFLDDELPKLLEDDEDDEDSICDPSPVTLAKLQQWEGLTPVAKVSFLLGT